jgi:hypothetical protein
LLQVQFNRTILPTPENVCEGHSVQMVEALAAAYFPATQVAQVEATPTAAENFPASHSLQAVAPAAEILPAGQLVQTVAAVPAAYLPSQVMQTEAPVDAMYVPAVQVLQTVEAARNPKQRWSSECVC